MQSISKMRRETRWGIWHLAIFLGGGMAELQSMSLLLLGLMPQGE